MGAKTTLSVAIFGAVLMFFLGSNIPLVTSLLGLSGRGSKRVVASALRAASEDGVGFSPGAGADGGGGGVGGAPRRTKNEVAAEVLRGVLRDDDRALCNARYPAGLTITDEQREYLSDQRYFMVITLRNNEELLHHALYELLNVIAVLGPRHVFVSVFENNSKDKTPQFLALFRDLLQLAGVPHNLVSTFTLQRELAALRASGALLAGGRRLLETGGAAGAAAANESATAEAVEAQWLHAAVEDELMAQLGGAAAAEAAAQLSGGGAGEGDGAAAADGEALGAAEAAALEGGLRAAWGALQDAAAGAAAAAAAAAAAGGGAGEGAETAAAARPAPRGRALAEDGDDLASDIAILSEGKWKGNRIEFLARVRNRSIRPLFGRKEKYDKLVIMNDAIFCAEDVLRLALHEDADVACGLDFDTTPHYNVAFYDTWVTKDLIGMPFKKPVPFIQRADEAQRLRHGKPFPVFCCWNGLLVANAAPFYEGVRFRRGVPGECPASECSLFCKDFWRKRARNFLLDPHVRVAYDMPTYTALHDVNWIDKTSPFATNASSVEWPEDIPWPPRPPERVHCCGLSGTGRDPDDPCFMEEQKLEL